jgi:hypothetical protein
LAKVKKPNFVKMTKVMEKEGEMIPKVIPKLGKHSKVKEDPPRQVANICWVPLRESAPPLFM